MTVLDICDFHVYNFRRKQKKQTLIQPVNEKAHHHELLFFSRRATHSQHVGEGEFSKTHD